MGIIIEWIEPAHRGTEYIDDIDLDNPEDCPVQMQTQFWDSDEGKFSEWEVKVQVEGSTDSCTVLVVKYDKSLNLGNPELQDLDDDYWGTNRIVVKQGQDHGNYYWKANSGDKFSSKGRKCGWKKKKLYKPRNDRGSHQQTRGEDFRPQIIALDQQCVITGETTEVALDAAHIIPAAECGNEIPDNGIALRADIHRLYDKKMFFICPYQKSGKKLKINDQKSDQLSKEYKKLLKKSKGLPPKTLKRVKEALEEVWPRD